jgi:alkaline phosphatase
VKPKASCFLLFCWTGFFACAQNGDIWLHAHNDYEKNNPLKEALKYAFKSIEVDIFLHQGRLVVSHIPLQLDFKPDLEELYFKPLAQLHEQDFWSQYPARPLRLMIDMKNASEPGIDSLRSLVLKYRTLFVGSQAPVRLVLSGGAQRFLMKPGDTLLWGLDDSVVALWEKIQSPDNYTAQASMSWPAFRKRYLHHRSTQQKDSLVQNLTSWFKGRNIPLRLYAAGNRPRQWKRLADWGFTVINVDCYRRARRWLATYQKNI